MKAKRLLFLVMVICLASGVKAQFYDSADDIYFYVEYKNGAFVDDGKVRVFNFDGKKAALLNHNFYDGDGDGPFFLSVKKIKNKLKNSPDYFEQLVETTNYDVDYTGTLSYVYKSSYRAFGVAKSFVEKYTFSSSRKELYVDDLDGGFTKKTTYKKVDKSFFRVGRSRTPSGTLYE